MFIRQ